MNLTPSNPLGPIAAYLGWDWSDQKHDLYLRLAGPGPGTHAVIPNQPEALHAYLRSLHQRWPAQKVVLCLEASRSALLPIFSEYLDWLIVYALNPKTLAKYREAFRPSGNKDDRLDCCLCADIALAHPEQLHRWAPVDAPTLELAKLVEDRRHTVDERTGVANQLKAQLKAYFPQSLDWLADDTTDRFASAWVLRWPRLEALQQSRPEAIRRFYRAHGRRLTQRLEELIGHRCQAVAVTQRAEWVGPALFHAQGLARQLALLDKQVAAYDQLIAQKLQAHPSHHLVAQLPGAGPVLQARLVAALGTDVERFGGAEQLAIQAGIAPIRRQSGPTEVVQRRRACPRFVHQTFLEFAKSSTLWCQWAGEFVRRKQAQGWGYWRALRALAYKWIRILHRLLRSGQSYDEAKYLRSLQEHQSPYALAQVAKAD